MKKDVLIIKRNLLPWYNELDDQIYMNDSGFPRVIREQIQAFGNYEILSINQKETHLSAKSDE